MKFPFFKNKSWSVSALEAPWGSRKSIYWHIANHIEEDTLGLTSGGEVLPDEELIRGDNSFSWAAGAIDGVLGAPAEGTPGEKRVTELFDAVVKLTEESSDRNLKRLYNLLTSEHVVGIVDRFLERIVSERPNQQDRLQTVARWLAMESPDREAVKFAISILGLFRDENDLDLLMTLGRHEEFTLFVAVAIQNSDVDVEDKLWKLAQHVQGWGRISIVERLATTTDDYIKDWLLREGYRNEIMNEYTALICARTGELNRKLKAGKLDQELINSAGEVLTAILAGAGPGEGYESYPEGAETVECYLKALAARENRVEALVFADRVERFLNDEASFEPLADDLRRDWRSRRDSMISAIAEIKNQAGWAEKVRRNLESADRVEFWVATEAAKLINIDPWPHFFERIKNGEDYWWNALQTDEPARIDALIAHAEATIPLNAIATGPSNSVGLGAEFSEHMKLDWVLQELQRFPGKGVRLIQAGLKSPTVRNRNMATRAVAEIPVQDRSVEIKLWLAEACAIEPVEETKRLMESTIRGESPGY